MDQETQKLLVARIRSIYRSAFDMAAHRRALLDLAGQIAALHDVLACDGAAQDAVETELEQVEGPLAYRVAVACFDRMAQAAQRAADALPPGQSRPALAFAAAAWLHIESLEMNGPPALYNDGAAVQSLKSLCDAAGLMRSDDAVRKALAAAVRTFDRYCPPPDVAEFLDDLSRQS